MSKTENRVHEAFQYLPVKDGSAAVEFCMRVFGAKEPRGQFSQPFLQKPPLRFLLCESEDLRVYGV